jgi:hypothetical protein
MFPMLWGSSLKFLHPTKYSSVKCYKSPSVVGTKLSEEQL